jgi:hypothetical protein
MGMTMKFAVGGDSDDRIAFAFNGKSMQFDGEAEMRFYITLPGQPRIPGKIEYTTAGWEFSLDLPMSSSVGIVEPGACMTCAGSGRIQDPELYGNTLWCPDCHEHVDELAKDNDETAKTEPPKA